MRIKDKSVLLLIDIQKGFEDLDYWGGERNNPEAEANAGRLLHLWRKRKLLLFHIKHCSTSPNSRLALGQWGNEIKDEVKPTYGETVIEKNVNSAFIGTDLHERLMKAGIESVVIAGLTTDHCVSTTARMAANFGFKVYVVEDATATFNRVAPNGEKYSAETMHQTALTSLNDEFAAIVSTEELIKTNEE